MLKLKNGVNTIVGKCPVCGKKYKSVEHIDNPVEGYECICKCGHVEYVSEEVVDVYYEDIDMTKELIKLKNSKKGINFISDNEVQGLEKELGNPEEFLKENGKYMGSYELNGDIHSFYKLYDSFKNINKIFCYIKYYWDNSYGFYRVE